SPGGSVTHWIDLLKAGDRAAAQPLWERYFPRLVGLARARLRGAPRRAADEEDVALSAFDSFCRNAEAGRFPDLTDRDGLWRMLATFILRKAARHLLDGARLTRTWTATCCRSPGRTGGTRGLGSGDEPRADVPHGWLTREFGRSKPLPVRFFLAVGTMGSGSPSNLLQENRRFRDVLEAKGYAVTDSESCSDHSLLNCRGAFPDGLVALFGR
ncbi:MAG TPA: ECF-type sigma factor, partial [Gemmataceae bacterium]|nr:ECF-type sigma factor [Gemmataceae bacterium]